MLMITFRNNLTNKGFTLVELLIAVVVGLVIMAAIYAMMNQAQHSAVSIDRRTVTQQDARAALDLMAMEIRMASFNKMYDSYPNLWTSVPVCPAMGLSSALANKLRKGIPVAGTNNLMVVMDLNSDGIIGCNSTIAACSTCCGPPNNCTNTACAGHYEYLSYTYDSANGRVMRNVNCGGNEAILGGVGTSTMVRNNLTGTALFQYFDETGAEITSANLAATPDTYNRLIRRIRINLVCDVAQQGATYKISRRTYSTDVLVKNHVLSP